MPLIYFLLLTYLTSIHSLPHVRVRPSSAVLPSSSEARLVCESADTPFTSIAYWTHVGQRIELNPSIVEMHGNELRLFQFGDTAYTQPGAYSCVVSTRYGLLESEPAMLSLPTLDPFKAARSEKNLLNLTQGNIAVVPCELPNGNPRATPIFSLDGNRIEIESNSNRYRILPSGNLHILNVQPSDAGSYQCAAKNPLTGQVVNNTQTTIVQVFNRPANSKDRPPLLTVYKPPVASRVLVGDNFTIECVIAGWPKPTVEWEKYGDVLPEKRHEVVHGTLYLYDIRLDDRGTFICRASSTNGQSDIAYTALLEVLESPKLVQRPDSLVQITNEERISIKCVFRGRPEPTVNWLYNGEELLVNGAPVTGGILTITQPRQGIYQCIGRNPYGIAQASAALVLPNGAEPEETIGVKVPMKKSLIVFGPNNITVYEGETVQLHCLTQSGSTVQWLHDNEVINLNQMRRYEMLSSGGLRIVSAQKTDSGVYECLASKVGAGTSSARCFVHVQGLAADTAVSVSKLEITAVHQINENTVELVWKINETIENHLQAIQVQYRLVHSKGIWMTASEFYNRSTDRASVSQLQSDQAYKFRLIGFDSRGKQLVISAVKRFTLEPNKYQLNLPLPEITDAWVTNDGHIALKWQLLNHSKSDIVDGFVIYYRLTRSKSNFSTVMVPNLRLPPIDTYTISSVEPDQQYELRVATYSNRGLSSMSNSIEIAIPSVLTHRHVRVDKTNVIPNLDDILENITKTQNPTRVVHDLVTHSLSSAAQKSSDLLYLTIGIIAGILFILILILIVMCSLRLFQRKKLLTHMQSVNGSEYYCDGMHKNVNPDYATTPCLQHAIVAVDGKLIPFAYPTNTKSPKIVWHGLPLNSVTSGNGTLRLNTNPINHLENDNATDRQENFYHTLAPLASYGESQGYTSSRIPTASYEHSAVSSCPIHHHLANYSSDSFRSKSCSNQKDSLARGQKIEGGDLFSQIDGHQSHYLYKLHGTYQRHERPKRTMTPSIHGADQPYDSTHPKFSTLSPGGSSQYCTHASNDASHSPSFPSSQQQQHPHDHSKNSLLSSTGSSSYSTGSTLDSPRNHWKYLTPLAESSSKDTNHLSSGTVEPIAFSSS